MGPESLRCLHHLVPPSSSSWKRPFHSGRLLVHGRSSRAVAYRLARRSIAFGSCGHLNSHSVRRSCGASCNEFSWGDTSKFGAMDDDDTRYVASDTCNTIKGGGGHNYEISAAGMFLPSKLEFIEPNLLAIRPETLEWPERDECVRISIERKANNFDIPISLRMIKKKQKWQKSSSEAGDFTYCSIKAAFSSMVLIIRELQSYALSARESLHCEDLQGITCTVHMEMNASFVWLFQQVFSRTPTLMVYVMLLLANFTAHSVIGNTDFAACAPSRRINCETIPGSALTSEEIDQEQSDVDHGVIIRGNPSGDSHLGKLLPGNQEKQEDEVVMRTQSIYETIKQFSSSVSVELEPDDYEEYHKTDLIYQMGIAEDPTNTLLLSNYAQFLYLVTRDYDRAEECFKRAIMVEPQDAEALSRYADFLWIVRKDLWAAEEKYQQAMATDPNNHHHASRYANFLWNTGGEETCFPLNETNDNQNEVL